MPKSTKNCRFAGVSVTYDTPSPGEHTLHFHATELHKKIAVWIKVPGKAMHTYIELPHDMDKLEALRYCITAPEFQDPMIHDYLVRQDAHYDPIRRKEMEQEEKIQRKKDRQEQKRLGIAKIKRVKKTKPSKTSSSVHMMQEATFGDDEFDEHDIPEALKDGNGKDET
jgi:hypothetical protein